MSKITGFIRSLIFVMAVGGINCDDSRNQHTNLDILTADYLVMENHLWSTITNGQNPSNTLEHVFSVHQMNFEQDFGDVGIFWDFQLEEHRDLLTQIGTINQTVGVCMTFLKSHNRRDVNELMNALIDVQQLADKIYEKCSKDEFWEFVQKDTRMCSKGRKTVESEQQIFYDYYMDVSAALTKAYILTDFAYMIRTLTGIENCRRNATTLRDIFKARYVSLQTIIKPLMRSADRFAWTCDADGKNAVAYANAIELSGFLQGYVEHEKNMNAGGSCTSSCRDYSNTKNYRCNPNTLCALETFQSDKLRCKGRLRNCQPLDGDISVCPTSRMREKHRYHYIEDGNGKLLGKNDSTCDDNVQGIKSWKQFVFFRCSNCLCYCDDKDNSDRRFSLREVVSSVQQNRIVTGVGFIKVDGIVQFLIVEQELIKYGQLNDTADNNDLPWKLGDQFSLNDRTVRSGVDFHALTWENRRINLDTIVVPQGRVVTGVKFCLIDGVLSLAVRSNSFIFETGKINDDATWNTNEVTTRQTLRLDRPDASIRTPIKSVRNNQPNLVVEFKPTDVEKDAAQHTVPYLDSLMAQPKHAVPLSGIGLYHKNQPGFGGFIAPQVIVYNFEPYISPPDGF